MEERQYMQDSKSVKTGKAGYILAFIIAFLPRLFWSLQSIPVRTISDEISTMNGAVFLSGQDWNAVVSNAGYYGFGMSILFAPLMKLISDPVILYRVLLICTGILECLAAVICFYLLKKVFLVEDDRKALLMTACISYMTVIRSTVFYNEHMLILLSWCICLILAKLVLTEDKKKRCLWTVLLCGLMVYGLTIHTRALTYMLGAAIAVFLYWLFYRKSLVSLPAFVVILAGGYIVVKKGVSWYQNIVWSAADGIRNSRVNIGSEKLATLKTVNGIKSCLFTIFGQINIASMISGGLLIAALVMIVLLITKKIKAVFIEKVRTEDNKMEALYITIGSFFVLCTAMTIAAQSLTWVNSASASIAAGYGNKEYGSKAFTYLRYMMPYLQPILMLILVSMENQKEEFKNYFYKSLKYVILFQGIWLAFILPYCYGNQQAGEEFICFAWASRNISTAQSYLPATLCLAVVLLISFWACKKDKLWVIMVMLLAMTGYKYCYNAYYWDILTQKGSEDKVDAVYELLGTGTLGKEKLSDNFYCVDLSGTDDHQVYYLLQYYFKDYKVLPTYPKEDEKEAILFTNIADVTNKDVLENYMCFELDNTEYLWVKGEKLQKKVLENAQKHLQLEHNMDLTQFYNSLKKLNQEDTVLSNGVVGCFANTKPASFISGKYKFKFVFKVNPDIKGDVATAELVNGLTNESYVSKKLTSEQINEDGTGMIEFTVSITDGENLQIKCSGESNTQIELTEVSYKKTSLTDYVGAMYPKEMKTLGEIAGKIETQAEIPMVSENNSLRWFADYTKAVEMMDVKNIYYCDDETAVSGKAANNLLLLENRNNGSLIYALLEKYYVVGKTDHYTLLAKKDLKEMLDEKGIRVYSGENGLLLEYYYLNNSAEIDEAKNFMLPYGKYELTLTGETQNTDKDNLGTLYWLTNGTEGSAEISTDEVGADGKINIKKQLEVSGFEQLKVSQIRFNQYADVQITDKNLWLNQTSDRNIVTVPLKNLSVMDDAERTEDGIVLGKNAGMKVFGPYLAAPAGEYKITFTFERDTDTQGDLGSVDVTYAAVVLDTKQIMGEDFKKGKAKISLDITLAEDETDPLLEFRTQINGNDTGIRLTAVEIEPE